MNGAGSTIPVITLDETMSTNTEAILLAHSGSYAPPFWVTAKQQSAGKGRDGRQWLSLPGNVQASLAMTLTCDLRVAPQISLVAGVGVIDAVRSLAEGGTVPRLGALRLKWPNDILFGTDKCGGILVQTTVEPVHDTLVAIIGIGLNVVSHPQISGRDVTDLAAEGFGVSAEDVFTRVAATMDAALQVWDFGAGFETIRARWLEAGTRIGTAMSVHLGYGIKDGFFAGLDTDGALLLRDVGGTIQRITFGDVML